MIAWTSSPHSFAAAWHNSGIFWLHTLTATVHHLPLILGVAAIPAAIRAFLIFETRPLQRWEFNLAEAMLTIWRVLIFGVAVWVVMTPAERLTLLATLNGADRFELALQGLGADLGRSLKLFLWEMVLFAVSFWLIHVLLSFASDWLSRFGDTERHVFRYRALGSMLRNLILVPLALIYLASIAYYAVL